MSATFTGKSEETRRARPSRFQPLTALLLQKAGSSFETAVSYGVEEGS